MNASDLPGGPARKAQLEFGFDGPVAVGGAPDGEALAAWRSERAREVEALCRRLALPLGHEAEVRLVQGPILRGVLRVAEETLWIEGSRDRLRFCIGAATFGLADIEAAVRLET